jgi:hypothetical protein
VGIVIVSIWQHILRGTNTLRIFSASIILSLLALFPHSSLSQEAIFTQASCTIVYSLERSANKYFNDEITQLRRQINQQNIRFIDLNNWGKSSPHIEVSGRLRNQLRQQYDLASGINQSVVVNKQGNVLGRHSGSVTLVNALMDCR